MTNTATPQKNPLSELDNYDWRNDPKLSANWKTRFSFFEKYLSPTTFKSTPKMSAETKKMSISQFMLIYTNLFALFLTFIYLGWIGLWRQALMLLAVLVIITITFHAFNLPTSTINAAGMGVSIYACLRTNVWYYLKKVKGSSGWTL